MIGEFMEFLGISFGFLFFDFQPPKAWHSLHLRTERYMTKPGGATFSCMRPCMPSFRPNRCVYMYSYSFVFKYIRGCLCIRGGDEDLPPIKQKTNFIINIGKAF